MTFLTPPVSACALAGVLLASVAQAAPVSLTYSATFDAQIGTAFGEPGPYAFSTTFEIDAAAAPVDVVRAGAGFATDFYGYGREALSGFAATYGRHTFTELAAVQVGGGPGAFIYFDAPLASGSASNFFLRAADAAGTLSLGSLDCSSGACRFGAFAVADERFGGLAIASAGMAQVGIAAPVPEPAAWVLMLAGLGAVGAAARRRRAGGRSTLTRETV